MVARIGYYTSLMEATLALAQSSCAALLINGGDGSAEGSGRGDGPGGQGVGSGIVATLGEAMKQAKIYLRSIESAHISQVRPGH